MPMVVIKEGVKESSLNRRRQHDLPTPESPMRRSLICWSLALCSSPSCDNHGFGLETYEEVIVPGSSHICEYEEAAPVWDEAF